MRIFKTILFFYFTSINLVYASNMSICNGSNENPCIIQDTSFKDPALKHWRTDEMLNAASSPTSIEKPIWVSASAMPSVAGFKEIVTRARALTKNKVVNIVDVDLRQESHLLLNGEAITLSTQQNSINLGKSRKEVIERELNWRKTLLNNGIVRDVLTKQQFKNQQYHAGKNISINELHTEAQVAKEVGLEYIRIPVTDHRAPLDNEVDRFVTFIKNLPPNTWIHLHCRGGKGRTATFFAMVDMLHHANVNSFDEIIKRQASVPPYYNLTKYTRPDPSFKRFYQNRFDFLKTFYGYAKATLNGYQGNWRGWLESNVGQHK